MTLLTFNPNLANDAATGRLVEQAARTHAGQAHFGGTGPRGATCGQCEHWRYSANARNAGCREYSRLAMRAGPAVPFHAKACRYFAKTEQARAFR